MTESHRSGTVERTDFERRVSGEITADEYAELLERRVNAAKAQHTDADYRISAGLTAEINAAREAILFCAQHTAPWTCRHCGQERPSPGREWLSPRDLREQANPPHPRYTWKTPHKGTSLSLALFRLVKEGLLETDTRHRVRLTKRGVGAR
jgi:hypothetical protein